MSAGKVIVMPIDKPQSRKKYYLAVFNSEQLCQVLYVYSPEEVLTLASQYQALGYRVEEGVVSGNGKYSTLRIFTPTSFNDIQHGIFA